MKRHFFLIAFLLLFSAFAMAQAPSVPTCDSYNTSDAPQFAATSSTLCTDYFGSPNWANSPLPAGSIIGYTLMTAGSGYVNPQVVNTDITGSGATAIATVDPNSGAITGVSGPSAPNYTMPVVTITDTNCGGNGQPACGAGAMVTAILGPPFTAGMGKFKDALPTLAAAVADTATFPGSDYYVIGLQQYSTQMHADLPPTTLRGYCQLNNPASPGVCSPSYLGPLIIAQKNRPVRVLFKNMLPMGAGGDLFIPVDTTYMGANDAQNRATLHLHGGGGWVTLPGASAPK